MGEIRHLTPPPPPAPPESFNIGTEPFKASLWPLTVAIPFVVVAAVALWQGWR